MMNDKRHSPCEGNNYYGHYLFHVDRCFYHYIGQPLLPDLKASNEAVVDYSGLGKALNQADFALMSHGTETDPVFNYANLMTLNLFERDWQDFTSMPSRYSAEAVNREERARLLKAVSENGYISDYCGIRIARSGKRFEIKDAVVWNVYDESKHYLGQAAMIRNWKWL